MPTKPESRLQYPGRLSGQPVPKILPDPVSGDFCGHAVTVFTARPDFADRYSITCYFMTQEDTTMIYQSMTDTIGKTPVIRLQRTGPDHVDIYVKPEAYNPAGSVKDRLALAIILDAEQSGALKPGQTVVEATSGNTGVALAAICAARGYPFVAVMTETFSIERRKLIKAYGGKLVLTPAEIRGVGMVKKARELAEKHGWS